MTLDPISSASLPDAAVGILPVQAILLAAHLTGHADGPFEAASLPGHLLHFVTDGEVEQTCNGRHYHLRPGNLLWYHENEHVRGQATRTPWRFYSVNFVAPLLPPPALDNRLLVEAEEVRPHFEALISAWRTAGNERPWHVHAALNSLLGHLVPKLAPNATLGAPTQLWWFIETQLRSRLDQPIDLALMEKLGHASAATIARACRGAVDETPLRRVKQIRLSMARGLAQRSGYSMTEIAHRVGYARVHEFSRDYKQCFGYPPSQEAKLT